jgi:DegV family protein with EDD domain
LHAHLKECMEVIKRIKDVKTINGKQLYYSFVAGANKIFEHQRAINKINVFPVPDGDTGTNLASTFRSIIDTSIPTKNIKVMAVSLADAALVGARGNSGIIFAQFLYGFSNEIEDSQEMDINNFSISVNKAVDYAYRSIQNPVEGTILTVLKEWAEEVHFLKDKIGDFNKLFVGSYKKATQSLVETKEKLEILAKHNVVDAGAKGFVVFLEGIIDFFTNGKLKDLLKDHSYQPVLEENVQGMNHSNFNFRYCTEAMIGGDNIARDEILKMLEGFGDSVVVAGSNKKVRIHVHTDEPSALFTKLHNYGTIIYQKVDDMIMQQKIANERIADIGLLTDSTCDIPQELVEKYQIHLVPLTIHFGDNFFLDRLTLKTSDFYKMFESTNVRPTTAQPSAKDFINQYNYLSTHYNQILGFHISGGLSGTFSNSKNSAQLISERTGTQINVLDSRRTTGALGLLVLRAAKAIQDGIPYDELVRQSKLWIEHLHLLVSVKTLKYMVRSGRVSKAKGFVGRALNLKPIVSLNDQGKSEMFTKSFSEKGAMQKIHKILTERLGQKKVWGYTITHVNNEKTALWYAEKMKAITGKDAEFIQAASPVLGNNTGPGTVAVSYLFE